jgi:hypothetical protein
MKRATQMFALTLTLLPLLAAAQMRSNDKLVANVPFQFKAGEKAVPAGECIVQSATMGGRTLAILNVAAKTSTLVPAMPEEPNEAAGRYTLVFHKYGDRYFLTGIRQGGKTIDRLPESGAEAELRAQNVAVTEEVLLASLK